MKLSNIFKKATKTVAKANIEKLEKNQLETVVGGVYNDSTVISAPDALKVKSGLNSLEVCFNPTMN